MPKRDEKQDGKADNGKGTQAKTTAQPKKDIVVDEGKASVTYSISLTKNLDNYESLKIQAGITIPYGADSAMLAELDKLVVLAREKVVNRLAKDITDITQALT